MSFSNDYHQLKTFLTSKSNSIMCYQRSDSYYSTQKRTQHTLIALYQDKPAHFRLVFHDYMKGKTYRRYTVIVITWLQSIMETIHYRTEHYRAFMHLKRNTQGDTRGDLYWLYNQVAFTWGRSEISLQSQISLRTEIFGVHMSHLSPK